MLLTCVWYLGVGIGCTAVCGAATIVDKGEGMVPIIVPEGGAPRTIQAAVELADFIEAMSGVRPEVIEWRPAEIPSGAIWVGYQPVLEKIFPGLDFAFEHPEEILIAADERNIVIVGRDVWNPDNLDVGNIKNFQQEYGTANAVYTFLQDQLGVRWFWPGEWGTDIIKTDTIVVEPFVYRYHPQLVSRGGLFGYSTLNRREMDWHRFMRLQLDSMGEVSGGHGFGNWWARFGESHPEYFALQPDGTRGLFGEPHRVKMCMSNMDVAKQWVDDVAAELERNPYKKVFNASPNDGWYTGHCVCENCRAWDHPDGELRTFTWRNLSQQYVALSDRDVTFANRVARMLKERFPDKELYVYMLSYGHSRPAPIGVVPDDNVIIGNVANFLLRSDLVDRGSSEGRLHKNNFADWGEIVDRQFWRPNVGSPVGFQYGFPDIPIRRTIDDMRFAADNGMMGIYVDYIREHWATQAPLYYIMAQLVWNPYADAKGLLQDYYQRAYGPAAAQMTAYWDYLEKIREEYYEKHHGKENASSLAPTEWYTPERLQPARDLLTQAFTAAEGADEKYRARIRIAEVGLDYTALLAEAGRLSKSLQTKGISDQEKQRLSDEIEVIWQKIRGLQLEHPGVMRWKRIFKGPQGDGPPALGKNFYPNG